MAIRVVVADDQTLIRETLSEFLREQADMEVVGQAADGDAAMELTAHLQPDVVVMDVSMPPVLSGLEATRWICATWPKVKVIALSMYRGRPYVAAMLKAGRTAICSRMSLRTIWRSPCRTVAQGQTYVSAGVDTSMATTPGPS